MPVGPTPRNGRSEYISGPRIPGAHYFDIDDIAPPSNPKNLPHMKPSPKMFASAMDRMGITPDDTLYVYGTEGCGFYHRAYWTLSSCGYHDPEKVKLVQGSLDEWRECGGTLEYGDLAGDDEQQRGNNDRRLFRMCELDWEDASPRYACWKEDGNDSVVDMEQVLAVVKETTQGGASSDTIIVDARSSGRFHGTAPEPRPGLRGGHMPGSINLPFPLLLDSNDPTKFRPMEEVRDMFVKAGIQPLEEGGSKNNNASSRKKVICSCGSGVTAAALAGGLEECGLRKKEDIYIYDGSWIEWGGDEDAPIVTD